MAEPPFAFAWNLEKDAVLGERYGRGFEDVVTALEAGRLIDERKHHNQERYPHQRLLVVEMDGYPWVVPYLEVEDRVVFLKTMFPSRKEKR